MLDARALDRVVADVDAPDGWYLKRGLTPRVLKSVTRGRRFVAARRRGKMLLLDLDGPATTVGLHLGMSGRILLDGAEAGDPLVYASNRPVPGWVRVRFRFDDGGSVALRDPRRLGRVELDPDERRWGPDAFELRADQVRVAVAAAAPLKAVLLDQRRIAGLGNLLVDEILWRSGLDPARAASTLTGDGPGRLAREIRSTLRILGRRGGSHTGDLPRVHGAPCPRDGAPLLRRQVAGRTTFSCPTHQQ